VERPAALIRARRAFTIIAAAAAIYGASAALARAGWTPPVKISAAGSIEVLGPQIASSQAGAAAVSFNDVNLDAQATAGAFLALARPRGAFSPARPVGQGVQEVLALAYSGRTLELLTAQSPFGQPCCTTVSATRLEPTGTFSRPQTIVSDVGGGTLGRLVPLANGRLLAVIAGPQGLWVTEARGTHSFAPGRRLMSASATPIPLAVTATPAGGSTVAWTEGTGQRILTATGPPGAAPSRPRAVLTLPAGHEIDGLQLVPRTQGVTLAWTESWSDTLGAYHSRAMAADLLGKPLRPRALSAPADAASALALAATASGDQVATWDACSPDACTVRGAIRSAVARWFGRSSGLGPIDPGESPQVTTGPDRGSLAGWIAGGRAVIAQLPPRASRFKAARPISGRLAANLDIAFGPSGVGVATWTQGTLAPDVFATLLR
jgi:hypothetical protein